MGKTRYHQIFDRLDELVGGISDFVKGEGRHLVLKSGGFMDLHIEHLIDHTISLTHYYRQNGDMMRDPDMEILVHPEIGTAEALTFEMSSPPIYQRVYANPEQTEYYPQLQSQLNEFLLQWLKNLHSQGFYVRSGVTVYSVEQVEDGEYQVFPYIYERSVIDGMLHKYPFWLRKKGIRKPSAVTTIPLCDHWIQHFSDVFLCEDSATRHAAKRNAERSVR